MYGYRDDHEHGHYKLVTFIHPDDQGGGIPEVDAAPAFTSSRDLVVAPGERVIHSARGTGLKSGQSGTDGMETEVIERGETDVVITDRRIVFWQRKVSVRDEGLLTGAMLKLDPTFRESVLGAHIPLEAIASVILPSGRKSYLQVMAQHLAEGRPRMHLVGTLMRRDAAQDTLAHLVTAMRARWLSYKLPEPLQHHVGVTEPAEGRNGLKDFRAPVYRALGNGRAYVNKRVVGEIQGMPDDGLDPVEIGASPVAPPAPVQRAPWQCRGCGQEVEGDAVRCPNCGEQRSIRDLLSRS